MTFSFAEQINVSIHASTQEATSRPPAHSQSPNCFNPRLHAGGDEINALPPTLNEVSIHASTQEATVPADDTKHS